MMLSQLPFSFALRAMTILNGIVVLFHILVLLQIIPYNVVWGGRLTSAEDMYVFEGVSLTVNLLLGAMLAVRGGRVGSSKAQKLTRAGFWVFAAVFALNTIGNLFAITSVEAMIGTPLTLFSAICCVRLAMRE